MKNEKKPHLWQIQVSVPEDKGHILPTYSLQYSKLQSYNNT